MKKYIGLVLIVLLIGALMVGFTTAVAETDLSKKGPDGQAGDSNTGLLYLYEKNINWEIVEDGVRGEMKYNLSGEEFEFVFNGYGLEADSDYTLIYYPDPWPGAGLICLGNGIANKGGNVHIEGPVKIDTDLPVPQSISSDTQPIGGAKIWLVLTDDIDCDNSSMTAWNPSKYLFENDRITFAYTDVCSWDGIWDSGEWGILEMTQISKEVTGTYDDGSFSIKGKVDGNTLEGTWIEGEETGGFKFTMDSCNSFVGTWGNYHSSIDGGEWNGTRK